MKILSHIILIFLFIFVSISQAQFRAGAFGGINSTNFAGDNPQRGSFSAGRGYHAGVIGEYCILEDVLISLQALYTDRSTSVLYDMPYQYEKYDSIRIDINYFEVPLNVKVVSDNEISYVTAGLIFAMPLDIKAINNRSGNEIDLEEGFESIVWCATFGVGIQFHIGEPMMFIELGYTQSLTNLTNIKIQEITLNNKLKSSSFQLSQEFYFLYSYGFKNSI